MSNYLFWLTEISNMGQNSLLELSSFFFFFIFFISELIWSLVITQLVI